MVVVGPGAGDTSSRAPAVVGPGAGDTESRGLRLSSAPGPVTQDPGGWMLSSAPGPVTQEPGCLGPHGISYPAHRQKASHGEVVVGPGAGHTRAKGVCRLPEHAYSTHRQKASHGKVVVGPGAGDTITRGRMLSASPGPVTQEPTGFVASMNMSTRRSGTKAAMVVLSSAA